MATKAKFLFAEEQMKFVTMKQTINIYGRCWKGNTSCHNLESFIT